MFLTVELCPKSGVLGEFVFEEDANEELIAVIL